MLEDPRVNFAISERSSKLGVDHLGLQAETEEELAEIHARLQNADTAIVSQPQANCCYAKSDKHWVEDPAGIAWESFRSLESIPFYGEHSHKGDARQGGADGCCVPTGKATAIAVPGKSLAQGSCCGS